MSNGEDWLLRPVGRQMCRYESLLDGSLTLDDIATMNEYLDVVDENQWRVHEALRKD